MISLSQTTGYAIQALACARNMGPHACLIRDIADRTGLPRAYLAQIVSRLSHQGIVATKRGYRGGISLARPAEEIRLIDVVRAIEGDTWVGPCLMGITGCTGKPGCAAHADWQAIRERLEAMLQRTTLAEVLQPIATARRGGARSARHL